MCRTSNAAHRTRSSGRTPPSAVLPLLNSLSAAMLPMLAGIAPTILLLPFTTSFSRNDKLVIWAENVPVRLLFGRAISVTRQPETVTPNQVLASPVGQLV